MTLPRIVSLLLLAQAAQGLSARTVWAVDSVSGVLDGSSPIWNRRVPDDGFRNLACGLFTTDATDDGMKYAVFEIQVSEPEALAVSVVADGTTIEDTVLYLYCDPFDPLQPGGNLVATADDILPGQDLLSAFTRRARGRAGAPPPHPRRRGRVPQRPDPEGERRKPSVYEIGAGSA